MKKTTSLFDGIGASGFITIVTAVVTIGSSVSGRVRGSGVKNIEQ